MILWQCDEPGCLKGTPAPNDDWWSIGGQFCPMHLPRECDSRVGVMCPCLLPSGHAGDHQCRHDLAFNYTW